MKYGNRSSENTQLWYRMSFCNAKQQYGGCMKQFKKLT